MAEKQGEVKGSVGTPRYVPHTGKALLMPLEVRALAKLDEAAALLAEAAGLLAAADGDLNAGRTFGPSRAGLLLGTVDAAGSTVRECAAQLYGAVR